MKFSGISPLQSFHPKDFCSCGQTFKAPIGDWVYRPVAKKSKKAAVKYAREKTHPSVSLLNMQFVVEVLLMEDILHQFIM